MSLLFNIFPGKLLPLQLHKCMVVYLFKKTSWVFVIINLLFPVNSSAWEEFSRKSKFSSGKSPEAMEPRTGVGLLGGPRPARAILWNLWLVGQP